MNLLPFLTGEKSKFFSLGSKKLLPRMHEYKSRNLKYSCQYLLVRTPKVLNKKVKYLLPRMHGHQKPGIKIFLPILIG